MDYCSIWLIAKFVTTIKRAIYNRWTGLQKCMRMRIMVLVCIIWKSDAFCWRTRSPVDVTDELLNPLASNREDND